MFSETFNFKAEKNLNFLLGEILLSDYYYLES